MPLERKALLNLHLCDTWVHKYYRKEVAKTSCDWPKMVKLGASLGNNPQRDGINASEESSYLCLFFFKLEAMYDLTTGNDQLPKNEKYRGDKTMENTYLRLLFKDVAFELEVTTSTLRRWSIEMEKIGLCI